MGIGGWARMAGAAVRYPVRYDVPDLRVVPNWPRRRPAPKLHVGQSVADGSRPYVTAPATARGARGKWASTGGFDSKLNPGGADSFAVGARARVHVHVPTRALAPWCDEASWAGLDDG